MKFIHPGIGKEKVNNYEEERTDSGNGSFSIINGSNIYVWM